MDKHKKKPGKHYCAKNGSCACKLGEHWTDAARFSAG
jgi:hypothetical protein